MTGTTQYTDLTPYRAAQVATQCFRAWGKLGADQKVEPQTMYSNKTIVRRGTKKIEGGQGYMFDGASFHAWLIAVKNGQVAKGGKVDLAALTAEYMVDATDENDEAEIVEADEADEDAELNELVAEEKSFEDVAAAADQPATA